MTGRLFRRQTLLDDRGASTGRSGLFFWSACRAVLQVKLSAGYHGCIKIKSQLMPFSYAQLVAMLTLIFCLTVPVAFMSTFGWFLVAPTFIMSLVYFGINTVAHRLADPFGTDSDDISLDSFATQIQQDLDDYVRNWSSSGASTSPEGPYQRTAHQP